MRAADVGEQQRLRLRCTDLVSLALGYHPSGVQPLKFEPTCVACYAVFANVSASAIVPRPQERERVAAGRVRVVGQS